MSDAELLRLLEESVRLTRRWKRSPRIARWLFSRFVLERGAPTRGIAASRGTYLAGMSTYLLKLGPDNLGVGYARSPSE